METFKALPQCSADERAAVLAKLSFEAPCFKAINDRVKRDDGLNRDANLDKVKSLRYIDGLLDRLNALNFADAVALELGPEDDPETTTGGWETEPIDVRGQE